METILIVSYVLLSLSLILILLVQFKIKLWSNKHESFKFETNENMTYPISQIKADAIKRPPCKGGFIGRPVYFDYTSSTDVANTCDEVIPPDEMGKDAGFRGRRLISGYNCRDPMII